MNDTAITPAAIAGLAAKIDGLDLSEAEQAALDAILDRAAEADLDVEGFGVVFEVEVKVQDPPDTTAGSFGDGRTSTYPKMVKGLGFDVGTSGVWTDMRPLS